MPFDQRRAITSPANGQPVKWTREDGEVFDLSTEWQGQRLVQTFRAEDGTRTNTYSISADGRVLTMHVVLRSPRLSGRLPGVVNFSVAVREVGDDIVFLRRLVPGGADRSYGVEVARLAGLPESVVARAREILRELETAAAPQPAQPAPEPELQLGLFGPPTHPALERLRGVDANRLTPLQALTLLAELADAART